MRAVVLFAVAMRACALVSRASCGAVRASARTMRWSEPVVESKAARKGLATWVKGKPKAVFAGVGPTPPSCAGAGTAVSGLPDTARRYFVLGVETSCDDTAAAVVSSDGEILGEAVASQHAVHAEFGGVVPGLARDAHAAAIESVVARALEAAGLDDAGGVDAVAATVGPGLEICLRVGARAASRIAAAHGKPFVRCHHLESHCLIARLGKRGDLPFPFLALLVSGGHCQLLWVAGVGDLAVLGGTLDDALGEAYDKAARMLGLAAPTGGGPAVEAAALAGNATAYPLPVPMRAKKTCDFSYAGLKNALRVQIGKARAALDLADDEPLPAAAAADLAASFQNCALAHIEDRLRIAFKAAPAPADGGRPRLAVVGGVAANAELRKRVAALCEEGGWDLSVPPPRLCTDNGAMVAWNAIEKLDLGFSDAADDDEVIARWPFREFAE